MDIHARLGGGHVHQQGARLAPRRYARQPLGERLGGLQRRLARRARSSGARKICDPVHAGDQHPKDEGARNSGGLALSSAGQPASRQARRSRSTRPRAGGHLGPRGRRRTARGRGRADLFGGATRPHRLREAGRLAEDSPGKPEGAEALPLPKRSLLLGALEHASAIGGSLPGEGDGAGAGRMRLDRDGDPDVPAHLGHLQARLIPRELRCEGRLQRKRPGGSRRHRPTVARPDGDPGPSSHTLPHYRRHGREHAGAELRARLRREAVHVAGDVRQRRAVRD